MARRLTIRVPREGSEGMRSSTEMKRVQPLLSRGWQAVSRLLKRGTDIPPEAVAMHEQGRKAEAAGDWNKALALFEQASNLASNWPYAVYDMAYTFLLMRDFDKARAYYA